MDALYAGCTRIMGSLDIVCAANAQPGNIITDLEVFQFVTEITGYLHVEGCANLPSLYGFRALQGRLAFQKLEPGAEEGIFLSKNHVRG